MSDLVLQPHRPAVERERIARYLKERSFRVRQLRNGLSLAIVAVVVLFVGSVALRAIQPIERIEKAGVDADGDLVIDDPRFIGRTEGGAQVQIVAKQAVRSSGSGLEPVRLIEPVMTSSDGTVARSETGTWAELEQVLTLQGDVRTRLPDGDTTRSAAARWEIVPGEGNGILTLSGGVEVNRENGDRIRGTTSSWDDGRQLLAVAGPVSLSRDNGETASGAQANWDRATGTISLLGNAWYQRLNGHVVTGQEMTWDDPNNLVTIRGNGRYQLSATEHVAAEQIVWDRNARTIAMAGEATVQLNGGVAVSNRALAYIDSERVIGNGNVRLNSRLGSATASQYEYFAETERVVLRGRVRGTIR